MSWNSTKVFYDELEHAGLPHSRSWMKTQEKKGTLVCPRTPGGHRKFTDGQISEIIEAFSPNGKGDWKPIGY